MNAEPWTLPPFVSPAPQAHQLTFVAASRYEPSFYECSCGERLFEENQARWHTDGSLGVEAIRRFSQTYLALIDLAWRRAQRYFTAMADFAPNLPVSMAEAHLVALDPFGAHFVWPDGERGTLPYEWLTCEDFEAALAAWTQAAKAVSEYASRAGPELPTLPAIEAARAVLERSSRLNPDQRQRRLDQELWSLMARTRRSGGLRPEASGGLGLALDSPEAALADMWHRSLFHGTPTGNHAAADLEAASRHLRDLVPTGWKLVRDEQEPK
jgi:tetratricopeptide (TPR) repeat protein